MQQYVLAVGNVNIRSTPDTTQKPLATLQHNHTLVLLEKHDVWHKVLYNGTMCYISARHTKVVEQPRNEQPETRNSLQYKEYRYSTIKVTRGINEKKGVVWHHTAGSLQGALSTIQHSPKKAGYHCLIDKDGSRHLFNTLDTILWHAGESVFKGRKHCNKFMIGIAFTGDTAQRVLTNDELQSAVEFIRPLWKKYNWSMDWMTTHRAISPGRKVDISVTAEQQLFSYIRTQIQ